MYLRQVGLTYTQFLVLVFQVSRYKFNDGEEPDGDRSVEFITRQSHNKTASDKILPNTIHLQQSSCISVLLLLSS